MTTRRTRRSPWPDRIAVAKDLILFTVGVALILYQGFAVQPRDFNPWAMTFGGVIAGVPGAIELWRLRSVSPPPTDGWPSEDLPPPSPSPSLPSSSV